MSRTLKSRLRGCTAVGVALAVAGLVAPNASLAADAVQTTAAKKASAPDVNEVVVVGSRIRHDNYNSPSPIEVITHDEATLAGFQSTTELLQGTAVTGGTAQINNAFGGFVTNGGPGANTIGLRGLGATRTLVLLNGRRLAPAGTRGAVGSPDLNVLPDAMIDHIEILKDGASSIYGSDAVAGVINIITKRGIKGATLEGQFSNPGEPGQEARGSIVAGWTSDRWEVSGSFEYYERDNLTLKDRSWTQCNTDYLFDKSTGDSLDFIDPKTGKTKCYPITTTGDNGVTINTIATNTRTGVGAPGTFGTRFNRWRPNAAVTTGLIGYEGVGGGGNSLGPRDTFEPRMLNKSLISPEKNYNLFLQGHYDLNALGNAEVYFEVLANRRSSSQTGYRQLSLDYAVGSPLIPAGQLRTSVVSGPTSITNGHNLGVRAFIGFGNDHSSQTVDALKATVGVRGDFTPLHKWRYDLTLSLSPSSADYTFQSWLTDHLADSLNVAPAPAGFNPALVRNGLTCASNIGNPSHGCISAPGLTPAVIGGQLPADWVNYTFVPVTGNTKYTEATATFGMDGPLFALPFGDVKGAFGAEYRWARINDTPAIDSQTGNLYNFTTSAVTRGSDQVFEGYGEIEAPLLANLPLAHALTVNVSGRYTHYRSYGTGWTYKIGGVYAPTDWISARASYGTSYRAPALFEQFQGATSGFLSSTNDPCNDYGALPVASNRYKNCAAELPGNPGFLATSGLAVVSAGGAAQGLSAETSTNFTAGVVLQPKLGPMFGDLSVAVDYYNIQVNNSVEQIGATNLLSLCYDSAGFRAAGSYCNYIEPRLPGNVPPIVHNNYTNIATERVRGIDYTLRYVRNLGPGRLRLNGLLTQYLEQSSRLFATDPFVDANGSINNPKYTANVEATYTYRQFKVRYGVDWIAAMNSYSYSPLFSPAVNKNDTKFVFDVPDYFLHGFSIQYTAPRWQATLGVHNLFDKVPPQISSGYYNKVGNAPLYSGYDYNGRTIFIDLSSKF